MKIKEFTTISIFAALTIVLQIIASFINISGFPITLTLIPIIVSGAIYGTGVGAFMGLMFGIVVTIMVVTGVDVGGAAMFVTKPIITISICLIKGALCGYVSAFIYKSLKNKNNKLALVLSAASAPIVNTGALYIVLILFFDSSFKAMIGAFLSINFVIEFLLNVLLAPGLLGLINHYKNR